MPPLFTIGYERASSAEVIEAVRGAGVELLVDVRAVAASRRAGFSKTVLRASLEAAGVDYLHLRDLGTPKAGREAARAGRCDEMRANFAGWLVCSLALMAALDRRNARHLLRLARGARSRSGVRTVGAGDGGAAHMLALLRGGPVLLPQAGAGGAASRPRCARCARPGRRTRSSCCSSALS